MQINLVDRCQVVGRRPARSALIFFKIAESKSLVRPTNDLEAWFEFGRRLTSIKATARVTSVMRLCVGDHFSLVLRVWRHSLAQALSGARSPLTWLMRARAPKDEATSFRAGLATWNSPKPAEVRRY